MFLICEWYFKSRSLTKPMGLVENSTVCLASSDYICSSNVENTD